MGLLSFWTIVLKHSNEWNRALQYMQEAWWHFA